jgi:hypothetical protein
MAGSTFRRAGALFAAGALAVSLGTADAATPAVDQATVGGTELCVSHTPIQAADLATGIATANCSLAGRVVIAGSTAVVVPPAGYGVGADGAAPVGGIDSPSLEVQNMGGVVTASVDGGLSPATSSAPTTDARDTDASDVAARDLGACNAGDFNLESGGHSWGQTLKWRYHLSSTPTRFDKYKALRQIKAGMTNMRTGHNDCGLKGQPRTSSKYLGRSTTGPNIKVGGGTVSCGSFNKSNVVGWGSLPNGLLGWTCYWWGGNGNMIAADMRLSPSTKVVLGYPKTCSNKYDLQSITTHEWGHAWGLAHVQNDNLTMHHFLPPCSPAFRTLGLGDWRGMRKLYGLR